MGWYWMATRERLLEILLGRGHGLRAMLYIGWFHVSNESQLESIRTYRRIAVHARGPDFILGSTQLELYKVISSRFFSHRSGATRRSSSTDRS